MTEPNTFHLIGLADPSGISLGFLVPLFSDGRSNAPLVQQLTMDGTVAGFELYEAPDAPRLPAPQLTIHLGAPAIHAFAFGEHDVAIIKNKADQAALLDRLDDPVLRNRPLLAMEVADLIDRRDLRAEFASEVHTELRKVSVETADRWRDLSVLTTDLRRILAQRREQSVGHLSETVVARVRHNTVEVLGITNLLSVQQRETLRLAVLKTVDTLAKLYPPPYGGWHVRILEHASDHRHRQPDAVVLLASKRARKLGHNIAWPLIPNIKVLDDPRGKFVRVMDETKAPLFVAYDADDYKLIQRASAEWAGHDMHGIAFASPRSRVKQEISHQRWRATHVSTAAIHGNAGAERSLMTAVRLAIAVELDRKSQGIRGYQSTTLLRARGLSPDPESDAWAMLYDRAWNMGLAPGRGFHIIGVGTMPALSMFEPGWALRALFHQPRFLHGPMVEQVMEQTRTTAALLVDTSPRTVKDEIRHRQSIARLLEMQRWTVLNGDPHRHETDLLISGNYTSLNVLTAPPISAPRTSRREVVPDIDLRAIRSLAVTCAATPGAVLERLVDSGVLAVDMRDLIAFDAEHATVLTLVGAQLRRFVTGIPSGPRTRLLALVALQAFKAGHVEGGAASQILSLIEKQDFGKRMHLVLRAVKTVDNAIVADVKILETAYDQRAHSEWIEIGGFTMSVQAQSITLLAPEFIRNGADHPRA